MGANPNVIKDNQDAVNRMQKFIADHLREPITQFQLSRAAGYSEYYAAKIFKEFTGRTPFEYIRLLRLAEASKKLRDGKSKVVDVAFDYVFDSHEGFTRAFAKEFGITPKRFSKHPIALNLFTPYEPDHSHPPNFNRKEEESMNEVTPVVFAQIMERPARKVLLKRVKTAENYFQFCEELGCDEAGAVWNVVFQMPFTNQLVCGCRPLCGLKEPPSIPKVLKSPSTGRGKSPAALRRWNCRHVKCWFFKVLPMMTKNIAKPSICFGDKSPISTPEYMDMTGRMKWLLNFSLRLWGIVVILKADR